MRKRLAGRRKREKRAGTRFGFSGFGLGLMTLGISVLLIWGGFYVYQILSGLPSIGRLERLAGPGGSIYSPTHYYDQTGQSLIDDERVAFSHLEHIAFSSDQAQPEGVMLATYALAVLTSMDGTHIFDPNLAPPISIEERLVLNLLLSTEPPSTGRTIRTKLLSVMAVTRYGRWTLLDWFLNTTSYGHGTWGAEQAARLYFNKAVTQLDSGESLVLAVIALNPEANPIDTPELFNITLRSVGIHLLSTGLVNAEVLNLADNAVSEISTPINENDKHVSAFVATVNKQLDDALVRDLPLQGGLTVITTLDMNIQRQLECAVGSLLGVESIRADCFLIQEEIKKPQLHTSIPDGLMVSFTLLDPVTGQIKAMLGDFSPTSGQQGLLKPHPSGSLTTPFIYLLGMLHGMSPASLVWDTPTGFMDSQLDQYVAQYEYQGPMSVRTALTDDHLVPAAKLLDGYGREGALALMSSFGLQFYASEGMPFSTAVTDAISIAQAFGVLANDGKRPGKTSFNNIVVEQPMTIQKIIDHEGQTLWEWKESPQQPLISSELAFLINDILISGGLESMDFRGSTKSGLTHENNDFWRVVYTPDYVFVVWMGLPDTQEGINFSKTGIDLELILILENYYQPDHEWQIPDNIIRLEVCYPSGLLPGEACPETVKEYFISGNEPVSIDNLFKQIRIDNETGRLATVFTNPAHVVQRVYYNPPPEEVFWAHTLGYLAAPSEFSVYQSRNVGRTIQLEEPQNFANVQGTIEIKGTLSVAYFISYRFDLGVGLAPDQWLQIGSSNKDLPIDNILGSLDTTKFQNGLYTLRIQAVYSGNIVDDAYLVILINNPETVD
ncbi:MAG: transglycosylase domain-containing protein [Anaerolineaceae bacterium]|nr:transglycosylase domain-containing protein [Anaerolineaceae bacterium]